jgi:hypothetical protein
MKLLDEIVDLLSREDGSLNEALLKTKVLLRTIDHSELVGWVSDELTGYPSDKPVPPYRQLPARVLGRISNGWQTVDPASMVPLTNAPPEFRGHWEVQPMTVALGVLEKMIDGDNGKKHLSRAMPPELLPVLSTMLSNGFHYERIWSQVELTQVQQLVIEVRSRLLDFILELRVQIGDSISDKDAKSAAASIDVQGMFAGAVIGPNATFQVGGSQNTQRVSNKIVVGDRSMLAAELRSHGVAEEDIAALDIALSADPTALAPGAQLGPEVKGWMKRMMEKAIDASWNIELGVAGGLLTSALQKYYGI